MGITLGVVLAVFELARTRAKLRAIQIRASDRWLEIEPDAGGLSDPTNHNITYPLQVSREWHDSAIQVSAASWAPPSTLIGSVETYKIIRERMASQSDLFDDVKVRMCGEPEGGFVVVRPTVYTNGVVTNEFAQRKLMTDGSCTYDPWSLFARDDRLLPLKESQGSNHLGVSLLIATRDNYLVLQQASSAANVGAGKVGPSVSGSVDWQDLEDLSPSERTVGGLAIAALLREYAEEIGLPQEWLGLVHFAGFGRIVVRGGKPEMVYCTKSHHVAAEWMNALESKHARETQRFLVVPQASWQGLVHKQQLDPSFSLELSVRLMASYEIAEDEGSSP